MITLYSTGCPKCKVLEAKLEQKKIEYKKESDVDKMLELGIKSAPVLSIDGESLLQFAEAVKWVNNQP